MRALEIDGSWEGTTATKRSRITTSMPKVPIWRLWLNTAAINKIQKCSVEPGFEGCMVGGELSSQEKLRQRVFHHPFDPHCLECQQRRRVSRASRRSLRENP